MAEHAVFVGDPPPFGVSGFSLGGPDGQPRSCFGLLLGKLPVPCIDLALTCFGFLLANEDFDPAAAGFLLTKADLFTAGSASASRITASVSRLASSP